MRTSLQRKVTLPQFCVLADAEQRGFTHCIGGERVAARNLAKKGFGSVTPADRRLLRFNINDAGRALLR